MLTIFFCLSKSLLSDDHSLIILFQNSVWFLILNNIFHYVVKLPSVLAGTVGKGLTFILFPDFLQYKAKLFFNFCFIRSTMSLYCSKKYVISCYYVIHTCKEPNSLSQCICYIKYILQICLLHCYY